jgi:hypothetical protein
MMNAEHNREVLLYVNEHYQPGDAVYVFWNMSHAYEYYKPAYQLRYDAVVGSFVKHISRSQQDYMRHLQRDFAGFEGKRRIWFVYDYLNRDAIGDYVNRPAWFHDPKFVPGEAVEAHFSTFARRVARYQHFPHMVTLFEVTPPALRRKAQQETASPVPAEAR